jgi:hypothetical protein
MERFALSIYSAVVRSHYKIPIKEERKVTVNGPKNILDTDSYIEYRHKEIIVGEAFVSENPSKINKIEWEYVLEFLPFPQFDSLARAHIIPEPSIGHASFSRALGRPDYIDASKFELGPRRERISSKEQERFITVRMNTRQN